MTIILALIAIIFIIHHAFVVAHKEDVILLLTLCGMLIVSFCLIYF
jgi:hypothetical protein